MTRMQSLRKQLGDKDKAYDQLLELFHVLRYGSDEEASLLLARLRLGDDLDELHASYWSRKAVRRSPLGCASIFMWNALAVNAACQTNVVQIRSGIAATS